MYPKYKISQRFFFNLFPGSIYRQIKAIGHTNEMDDYERRKLSVFNQVNFLGIIVGIAVPVLGLFDNQNLPMVASLVAFSPFIISLVVLFLNYYKLHEWARLLYFSLYPVLTCLVYGAGLDLGLEIFFILYAVLAVFYMAKPANAIFSFALSSGCYMIVYVFSKNYNYVLRTNLFPFYVFIHALALILIFFALYWLKKENIDYQYFILQKNNELRKTNIEIESQKKEISQKANQLEELNLLKNKLFSVISHDLKGPIYAQRTLFENIEKYDLPVEDIKPMVPEILKEMNATISLMDNLLQWSKSQMQSVEINMQYLDIGAIIKNVLKVLSLQAKTKGVTINLFLTDEAPVFADKDMIELVIRNLVSNAIKFTDHNKEINIELLEEGNELKVRIADTGIGMSEETLAKISQNIFYSTKGTANEMGTGLGLMLCSEYLRKNGSSLHIKSRIGAGSTFSFGLAIQKEYVLEQNLVC